MSNPIHRKGKNKGKRTRSGGMPPTLNHSAPNFNAFDGSYGSFVRPSAGYHDELQNDAQGAKSWDETLSAFPPRHQQSHEYTKEYPQEYPEEYSQEYPQGYSEGYPQGYPQEYPQEYTRDHPHDYAPPPPPPTKTTSRRTPMSMMEEPSRMVITKHDPLPPFTRRPPKPEAQPPRMVVTRHVPPPPNPNRKVVLREDVKTDPRSIDAFLKEARQGDRESPELRRKKQKSDDTEFVRSEGEGLRGKDWYDRYHFSRDGEPSTMTAAAPKKDKVITPTTQIRQSKRPSRFTDSTSSPRGVTNPTPAITTPITSDDPWYLPKRTLGLKKGFTSDEVAAVCISMAQGKSGTEVSGTEGKSGKQPAKPAAGNVPTTTIPTTTIIPTTNIRTVPLILEPKKTEAGKPISTLGSKTTIKNVSMPNLPPPLPPPKPVPGTEPSSSFAYLPPPPSVWPQPYAGMPSVSTVTAPIVGPFQPPAGPLPAPPPIEEEKPPEFDENFAKIPLKRTPRTRRLTPPCYTHTAASLYNLVDRTTDLERLRQCSEVVTDLIRVLPLKRGAEITWVDGATIRRAMDLLGEKLEQAVLEDTRKIVLKQGLCAISNDYVEDVKGSKCAFRNEQAAAEDSGSDSENRGQLVTGKYYSCWRSPTVSDQIILQRLKPKVWSSDGSTVVFSKFKPNHPAIMLNWKKDIIIRPENIPTFVELLSQSIPEELPRKKEKRKRVNKKGDREVRDYLIVRVTKTKPRLALVGLPQDFTEFEFFGYNRFFTSRSIIGFLSEDYVGQLVMEEVKEPPQAQETIPISPEPASDHHQQAQAEQVHQQAQAQYQNQEQAQYQQQAQAEQVHQQQMPQHQQAQQQVQQQAVMEPATQEWQHNYSSPAAGAPYDPAAVAASPWPPYGVPPPAPQMMGYMPPPMVAPPHMGWGVPGPVYPPQPYPAPAWPAPPAYNYQQN